MRPELLAHIYRSRPCFICNKHSWCQHREPQVDIAECSDVKPAFIPTKPMPVEKRVIQ